MSHTFSVIRDLYLQGILNNNPGFTAADVIAANTGLNKGTVKTFLAKHCMENVVYFERVVAGRYRIRQEYLIV